MNEKHKRLRDAYADVFPSKQAVEAVLDAAGRQGRLDWELAPLMAERLRHVYPQIMETVYPELLAANGGVLPIDSSPSPADETYRYYLIDQQGKADWIDDDGTFAPSNSATLRQFDGRMAEFGHKWDVTIFDLERAAQHPSMNLQVMKGRMAKRAHDEWKNWVWLFGDKKKELEGLCNNPDVAHFLAPLNGGASSRLWANKTDAEMMADVEELIDSIPDRTKRAYFAATVFMPLSLVQEAKSRYISATASGNVTVWDRMLARYSGDETGQMRVEFKILNECAAAFRVDPKTGTDTSGLEGDFMMALPAADASMLAFVQARPFSQRPPQEEDLKIKTLTHEKIGGCRCQIPQAVSVMRFGTT